MNVHLIGGIGLMLCGSILFTGEKSLGIHNPPVGVLLIGAGFLLSIYSYIDGSRPEANGPRQRVRDHFV